MRKPSNYEMLAAAIVAATIHPVIVISLFLLLIFADKIPRIPDFLPSERGLNNITNI